MHRVYAMAKKPASIGRLPRSQRSDKVERDAASMAQKASSSLRPSQINLPRSGPLPAATRSQFERAFHWNFSDIRIHAADEATRAVNARAFAYGRDIYLGQGGCRLDVLAHELSHVVQYESHAAPLMLLRDEGKDTFYIRQITGDDAKKYLDQVDAELPKMEAEVQNLPKSPENDDFKAAVARLKGIRAGDRVTVWETRGANDFASYHAATDEIRLHKDKLIQASGHNLMHEAIHALHASQYPKLAKAYGAAMGEKLPLSSSQTGQFLKWKAWTEYWAYHRTAEFDNLKRSAEYKLDPHKIATENKDFRAAWEEARKVDNKFVPWEWTPPKN